MSKDWYFGDFYPDLSKGDWITSVIHGFPYKKDNKGNCYTTYNGEIILLPMRETYKSGQIRNYPYSTGLVPNDSTKIDWQKAEKRLSQIFSILYTKFTINNIKLIEERRKKPRVSNREYGNDHQNSIPSTLDNEEWYQCLFVVPEHDDMGNYKSILIPVYYPNKMGSVDSPFRPRIHMYIDGWDLREAPTYEIPIICDYDGHYGNCTTLGVPKEGAAIEPISSEQAREMYKKNMPQYTEYFRKIKFIKENDLTVEGFIQLNKILEMVHALKEGEIRPELFLTFTRSLKISDENARSILEQYLREEGFFGGRFGASKLTTEERDAMLLIPRITPEIETGGLKEIVTYAGDFGALQIFSTPYSDLKQKQYEFRPKGNFVSINDPRFYCADSSEDRQRLAKLGDNEAYQNQNLLITANIVKNMIKDMFDKNGLEIIPTGDVWSLDFARDWSTRVIFDKRLIDIAEALYNGGNINIEFIIASAHLPGYKKTFAHRGVFKVKTVYDGLIEWSWYADELQPALSTDYKPDSSWLAKYQPLAGNELFKKQGN